MGALWPEERNDKYRELYAEGLPHSEIATRMGISRNASIGKAHRLGLPGRARKAAAKPWVSAGISERTWRRRKHTTTVRPPQAQPRAFVLDVEQFEKDIAPDIGTLTLFQLENHHCRWPCGHPGEPGFLFCADPTADVVNGRPYCGRHAAIAHQPVRVRTDPYWIDTNRVKNRGRRAA